MQNEFIEDLIICLKHTMAMKFGQAMLEMKVNAIEQEMYWNG